MQANRKNKRPNARLRSEREARGWTQQYVAEQLGADINIVSRWECGERKPGPYYRQKLIELFGKSAVELGLLEIPTAPPLSSHSNLSFTSPPPSIPVSTARTYGADLPLDILEDSSSYSSPVESLPYSQERLPEVRSSEAQQLVPCMRTHSQAIELLSGLPEIATEQQLGAWLAMHAVDLALLFDEGWTLESVLSSLQFILQGVQAMPSMTRSLTRRRLFHLGAAAIASSIPIPEGRHISAEDRVQLCQALGDTIAAGWKQLYAVDTAQALAVAQAQLFLLQQSHSLLYPQARSLCYTGIYGQIGMTLHFQERDGEALQAYRSSYIAALEAGEPWYVVQSLICQADSYTALRHYDVAIRTIEEALRIIGDPTDEPMRRARAHLLTCWADNAMMLQDFHTTEEKLDTAGSYLSGSMPDEEFDQSTWLLLAGKHALKTGNYGRAQECFQQALREVPQQWIFRHAMIAIGLAMAYAGLRERDESLATAEQVVPMLKTINAPMTNRLYSEYLQQDLLGAFPTDTGVHSFVAETYQGFPQLTRIGGLKN
jgi:transcriptional regulator with XRE-family HTH domain/tetratricopeptide (TPR) repeat protein